MAEEEEDSIVCTLVSRGRCTSGVGKKDDQGVSYFFSERSMAWESVADLQGHPAPGRVLCLAC